MKLGRITGIKLVAFSIFSNINCSLNNLHDLTDVSTLLYLTTFHYVFNCRIWLFSCIILSSCINLFSKIKSNQPQSHELSTRM